MVKMFGLALLVFSITQSTGHAYTVKGLIECPEMIEEHETERFRLANEFWLLGYISGRNFENDSQVGTGVDDRRIYDLALDFCRRNPDKDIDDAAIRVFEFLSP